MMEHNGSIETKQSRIRLMEQHLNSYESKSKETCLGNRGYDSVLSLISNDVFASQQCLSMKTIMMKHSGSIKTKQNRIRLMEQRFIMW